MEVTKIWRVVAESDLYDGLAPEDPDAAAQTLRLFDGTPIERPWTPLRVRVVAGPRAGDFPSIANHVIVMRPRAVAALGSILERCGESVPLACPGENLVAFSAAVARGAIDPERTRIERFPSGRFKRISAYAFRVEAVSTRPLFKIAEEALGPPFALEEFRRRVEESGLRGLRFTPVS